MMATEKKPAQKKAAPTKSAATKAAPPKRVAARPSLVKPKPVVSAAHMNKKTAPQPPAPTRKPTASTKANRAGALYDVHPGVAYVQAIVDNMPAKTGRSIDEWAQMVISQGPTDPKGRRDWLKHSHKLGGTTVWMIVEYAAGRATADTDPDLYLAAAVRYVEAMYTGPKVWLRPVHDALISLGRSLGDDVKVCPCQTIVPLYRAHVFAQVKPTSQSRIDFGLALKGVKQKLPRRLFDTGGLAKGDRITHRFEIKSPGDVDDEVRTWARIAYDLDV